MIKNFRDHSANERTFLAWVRTAITVMAFGFLVEKFDLFLGFTATGALNGATRVSGQAFGNLAGLALIALGIALVLVAAVRFLMIAKSIDRDDVRPLAGARFDIALATLLGLLSGALFLYLSYAIFTGS